MSASVTPMVLKLLGSALQRGVSVVFQKISRLRKVDAAIKGQATTNDLVKTAVSDYEIVIGSYYGNFTTSIDDLHRSLEKTGIIESMVEAALVGRQSSSLQSLFKIEHDRVFGSGNGNSDELYNSMYTAFAVTLRELCKDTVLYEFVKASHKEISARLDDIELALNAYKTFPSPSVEDVEVERANLLKLTKGLQQSYKEVRIETIRGGARLVDIDKIYIPPKLSLRTTKRNEKRIARAMEAISASAAGSEQLSLFLAAHDSDAPAFGRVTYKELKATFRRVVILGDPGGGKSTICQKICYDMSRNASLVAQYGEKDRIPGSEQKLAVRVILRRFEQARVTEPQLDLLTYICRDILHYVTSDIGQVRSQTIPMLEAGRALLAFDGLDEILDTSKRRELADLVTAFCDRYPLCPVIVTSRLVGYDDARLPDSFEEFVLEKFDDDEVNEYLRKFMVVVGEKSKSEADAEAAKFIEQTNKTASDLRRNPLLLGLMAYLFNSRGDVPSNRPEIYKDCSTLMFDKWDGQRGILADIPSDFERAELFSELASRIYTNVELSAGVDRDWLLRALREFFETQYMDKSRAIQAARSLVEFIVGRAWVMSEIGDGIFSFTHQTFLEYFFSRHLDASYDTVADLFKNLKPKIHKREWDVVAHLSLQLKTNTIVRKQDEALSLLNAEILKPRKDKGAILSFAARSFEYLSGSEASVAVLLQTIYQTSTSNISTKYVDALRPIVESYDSARSRKSFVGSLLSDMLAESLTSDDPYLASVVALAISGRTIHSKHRRRWSRLVIPSSISKDVRDKAKQGLVAKSQSDPLAAVLSLQWYAQFEQSWIEKFGLGAFLPSFIGEEDLDGLSLVALASSDLYEGRFRPSYIGKEVFENFLRGVAAASPEAIVRDLDLRRLGYFSPPRQIWAQLMTERREQPELLVGLATLFNIASRAEVLEEVRYGRHPGRTERATLHNRLAKIERAAGDAGGEKYQETLRLISEIERR